MRRIGLIHVFIAGLLLCFCGMSARMPEKAPAAGPGSVSMEALLPVDPSVTLGELENGIRYFVRVNKRPENRAELRLVVNAGSVLEDDDQRGLAHFCEHMAFNGTEHFEKHELIDFLESIGMRFGPEINAYTSFDETVYMLEIPTDSLPVMEKAFLVLHDWACGVTFDADEIERERGVIIEEWRSGRGASARMMDKQFPVLFKGSRYAERMIIGEKDIIENCDHETLRRYYRDWYRPDLMAVVAIGDFDEHWIEAKIRETFGMIPRKPNPRERVLFPVPDHEETYFAIATDPEAAQTSVSLYFKRDVEPEETVQDYRRLIMEGLYDAMMNLRLEELTQKADPPVLYGVSSTSGLVRTKDAYFIAAGVEERGVERGLEAMLTEAVRVERFGFTSGELERVKSAAMRSMERAFAERDKSLSSAYAAEYIRNFLEQEPIPGIEVEFNLYKALMPGITLDEINAMAGGLIAERNRVILVNAPEKEDVEVPGEDDLLAVFRDVALKEIVPYVDDVSEEPLISGSIQAGTVAEESRIDSIDVTEWKLSNGVRVVMKPTDFKNDEILFTSFSPGGNSMASDDAYIPAATATMILTEGGVGRFGRIELQKKLAGKAVTVTPFISSIIEGIRGGASPKDVETMFQLIYLYFNAPRKDSTAFLSIKSRIKGLIENRSAQPEAAFIDTIQVTMGQYHHRVRPWSLDLLDELELDLSYDFYKDRFADAGDFTFLFVGNFKPEELKPYVLLYLASLPFTGRDEEWRDVGIEPPEGVIEKTVRRGIESKGRVFLQFTGPYVYTRWNNYALSSMVEVMQIKLREVIREALGGTYGVSISSSSSKFPKPEYSVTIDFECDPDRVDELTRTVFTQIDSIQIYGPALSYIQKVKEAQLRSNETHLKENRYWLGGLYSAYFYGSSPMNILAYRDLVGKLDADTVKEASSRYLRFDNYARFVLLPKED